MSSTTAELAELVGRLSLEQKVELLTGKDAWTMHGQPAIGLRPLVFSDGPAGVRGRGFDPDRPSSSLPAPVALGATWDPALVESLANALGRETRARGVDVLLAPTVNIIRTPLSGRAFECFSEDPLLTARLAVAYVRGLQAVGVAATVKHYVGNDSETDRRTYDARIAEGVLRELYLPPFEACVKEADVALVMAAYNSVNGATMTANRPLLEGVLKGEWNFEGVVVSDWTAAQTTTASALGGLDLAMPGPHGPWGDLLLQAVRAGAVPISVIDDKVTRLLRLAQRLGAIGVARNGASSTGQSMVDERLLREVTARSFVLLKNDKAVLPLDRSRLRRLALIGPNAIRPQTQGGGSVRVLPVGNVDLVSSLRKALGDGVTMTVDEGCVTWTTIPPSLDGAFRDPETGKAGVRLEVRDDEGRLLRDAPFGGSVLTWWDGLPPEVNRQGAGVVMRTTYRPAVDGPHLIGAAGVGLLRVTVDGKALAEARTVPPREVVETFSRPPELRVPVDLRAGEAVEVQLDYRPDIRGREGFVTLRLGIAPNVDDDRLLAQAVAAAAAADVAVVVVGSAEGTESEGYDRKSLSLPGRQDELIERVAAANPKTVVVVNAGSPMLMPWAQRVATVMQVWLPGQAFGEALADTLLGVAEPGGRLPVSLPEYEADSPVLHATPTAGELPYDEGLLVGYRGYDRNGSEPQYAFGHGLGYTEWNYESLELPTSISPGQDLPLTVTVRNTGERVGREVVQIYLEAPDDDPTRPLRTLAGFASVSAQSGGAAEANVTVPARAFSRWDEASHAWVSQTGTYAVCCGRSSRDFRLRREVAVR